MFSQYDYVSENIALGKLTFQSSTFSYSLSGSSNAVDGDSTNIYTGGSCASTRNEKNAWWAVDLEYRSVVRRVYLTNRGENIGESQSTQQSTYLLVFIYQI